MPCWTLIVYTFSILLWLWTSPWLLGKEDGRQGLVLPLEAKGESLRCPTHGGMCCKGDTDCNFFELDARGFQFFQVHFQSSISSEIDAILR